MKSWGGKVLRRRSPGPQPGRGFHRLDVRINSLGEVRGKTCESCMDHEELDGDVLQAHMAASGRSWSCRVTLAKSIERAQE